MVNKCKISYEYMQYDGTNGKEVAAFIKSKIKDNKNFEFEWEEVEETCYDCVKKLMWKYYNPKLIEKDNAFICAMFEGQYVLWDKLSKDVHVISLHKFKETYEEDEEEYVDGNQFNLPYNTPLPNTNPVPCPNIYPYPGYPQDPQPMPLSPWDPRRTEVWCGVSDATKPKAILEGKSDGTGTTSIK